MYNNKYMMTNSLMKTQNLIKHLQLIPPTILEEIKQEIIENL